MRGVAPLLLGIGALAVTSIVLYLALTPTGQALVKGALNFVSDILDLGNKALNLLIQLVTISLSIMAISFTRINTVTGLILFIVSLIGNFAIAYVLVVFIASVAEKIKNIIKP